MGFDWAAGTVAEPWRMHRATLQCMRCQSNTHRRVGCDNRRPPVCARCSGPHETKSCARREIRCCHCQGPHAATYRKCPSRLEFLRGYAHRTGLPLPPTHLSRPSVCRDRRTTDDRMHQWETHRQDNVRTWLAPSTRSYARLLNFPIYPVALLQTTPTRRGLR